MAIEYGTRNNLDRYIALMNSSEKDKINHILPFISEVIKNRPSPKLLSIGAGSGKLEQHLANIFPQLNVIALDYSAPMIEQINGESLSVPADAGKPIIALLAQGESLPFADKSFDAIITCSVVHEIASFSDNHSLGDISKQLFGEIGRVLKSGGVYVCRDFMQPENPDKSVGLRIGKRQSFKERDPKKVARYFFGKTEGIEKDVICEQLGTDTFHEGTVVQTSLSDAMEFIVHYSWSKRIRDEVKERYTYLPPREYSKFVIKAMQDWGVEAIGMDSYAYLQDGYTEHTEGRMDLVDDDCNRIDLPPFTGVVAIQKL